LSVALTGDLVITEGEIGFEMYIILQGRVTILKDNVQLGQLTKGDFFGEGGLVNGSGKRGASVRSLKMSIFYVLDQQNFDALQSGYPEDIQIFINIATRRKKAKVVVRNTAAPAVRNGEQLKSEEEAEEEKEEAALMVKNKKSSMHHLIRSIIA
ncbi:hypothetical protein CYMTET_23109, partial [Cymbomonas tetramitiformis]